MCMRRAPHPLGVRRPFTCEGLGSRTWGPRNRRNLSRYTSATITMFVEAV